MPFVPDTFNARAGMTGEFPGWRRSSRASCAGAWLQQRLGGSLALPYHCARTAEFGRWKLKRYGARRLVWSFGFLVGVGGGTGGTEGLAVCGVPSGSRRTAKFVPARALVVFRDRRATPADKLRNPLIFWAFTQNYLLLWARYSGKAFILWVTMIRL